MSYAENGQKLKALRESLHLQQGAFAKALYLTKSALVEMETDVLSDGYMGLIEWYMGLDLTADENDDVNSLNGLYERSVTLTERERYNMVYDTLNWKQSITAYMSRYRNDAQGITENFLYRLWNILRQYTVDDFLYLRFHDNIEQFAEAIYETPESLQVMIDGNTCSKPHLLLMAFKIGMIQPF